MPWAAIAAGIGAGSSLLGGFLGSGAARKAAGIQYQGTIDARRQLQELFGTFNPQIMSSAENAANLAYDTAGQGREALSSATAGGQTAATAAAQRANELLDPYLALGGSATRTLGDLMAPGGDLSRNFTVADMATMDPGYQFRINEAQRALQTSAAARGGLTGGGAMRALDRQVQNVASSELGTAFDRFQTQQTNRFNRLNTLVNLGANTAGTMGQNTIGAGRFAANLGMRGAEDISSLMQRATEYGGNLKTQAAQIQAANAMDEGRTLGDWILQGANARAGGTVGAANAWSGAAGGVANAASGYAKYQLLKGLFK